MMLLMWFACTTPFSNSESEGVWVQSDFQFDLNRDCQMAAILTDARQFSYQFGDGDATMDTGYWDYSLDPDMIGSYKNSLWGYCSRWAKDSPSFTCPMPLFLAHYADWREDFYLEELAIERECQVQFYQASEDGLFIDNQTVRLVSTFYAGCVIETEDSYQEVGLCAGTVTSKLTRQP